MFMNLKQLEVFIAVADSGSFSRAAESAFLTQSTVSQHISSLEKEFDLKLLDRTGKGAFPTEAGKLLLEHARRILQEGRDVALALNRFRGLAEVALKIGGSNIPACYMIPDCIFSFRENYPGVVITLYQGDSRETLERLKCEEVEFALVGTIFAEKDLVFTPLAPDRISLVVPAGHRWYGKKDIAVEELLDEPLILRESGSGTGSSFRDALVRANLDPDQLNVSLCLGSNEAVKQAILNGAGISFVSELSVRKECERGELFLVAVRGMVISRHFYLVTRRGRSLSPAAEAFVDSILQRFGLE
jgi:DNA-binding transcriptional LysR family regulator